MLSRLGVALSLSLLPLSAWSLGEQPSGESRITCNTQSILGSPTESLAISLDGNAGGSFTAAEGSYMSAFNGAIQGADIEVANDNSISEFFIRKELPDGRFISIGIDPFVPSHNGEFVAVIYHQAVDRSAQVQTVKQNPDEEESRRPNYLPSRRVNCRLTNANELVARAGGSGREAKEVSAAREGRRAPAAVSR